MNTFTDQFLEMFADNEYTLKQQTSDTLGNRDKGSTAQLNVLDEDSIDKDAAACYELNGKSDPKELLKYLKKHLRRFKREYLAVEPDNKGDAYSTLLASLNRVLANFTPTYKVVMESHNSSLKELFNVKLSVLKSLNEFISSNPTDAELKSVDTAYFFTVNEAFIDMYEIHLNRLYEGLIGLQLIDCSITQFKMLFRPDGKTRMKTPEPIIWLSAYSHLAHFIKCLVDAEFIPNKKRPSFNDIAKKLFYEKKSGSYFKRSGNKKDVKDDSKSPYREINEMVQHSLRLKTRP